ncbi:gametocyte-specific factor 1 isoform X2 [Channa argus]|uniref:gametocyte-specific factor 1 isoform X2 n=1 Tax=Channa argus TaxID=215402 RepID=UPI0035206D51
MATIRFETTSGPWPCRIATSERAQLKEEEDKSDWDPDKLLQCPFDKNHQIRACRFPYHLIKCRKNHPKLASELKTCPFNARHLLPKHELKHHMETCADRISMGNEDGGPTNEYCKWQVPVTTWVNPNMTEDWDNGWRRGLSIIFTQTLGHPVLSHGLELSHNLSLLCSESKWVHNLGLIFLN